MKKFFKNLTLKQILLSAAVIVCLLCWLGLTVFATVKKNQFYDQLAAARWSDENDAGQVTCFFTEKTEITKEQIMNFGMTIKKSLMEASLVEEDTKARLWVDAYSAPGTVNIVNGKNKLEANAVGVGGDFFYFHPVELLNGTYFSGNDLMQDKIVIDEDAAWQLFGSNDVTGMVVDIGGVPHYVSGVVKREEGRLAEGAGLGKTVVYTSIDSLSTYGTTTGINTYETVMPSPVKGFAYNLVKEKFGMEETSMWVVDNTARFEMKGLLTVISEFGTRSMQSLAINYPYWENLARGWEDILAMILILQIFCLFLAFSIIICSLAVFWKRKNWKMKDLIHFIVKTAENIGERMRSEKNKWKYF